MSVKFVLLIVLPIIVQFAVCSLDNEWVQYPVLNTLQNVVGPLEETLPYKNYSDFENRHTNDFLWARDRNYNAYYACIDGVLYAFDKSGVAVNNYFVYDALQCLNCLAKLMILQPEREPYLRIASFSFHSWCEPRLLSVPIKNYRGRDAVNQKELSRRFMTAKTAVVRNKSNLTQEGLTPAYEKSFTATAETRIAEGAKISSTVSVSVPLASSVEFGVEFSGEWSKTNSKSWTETLTAPAQKVNVGPESQVHAKWSLYEFTRVYTYSVSLQIDDGSTGNELSAGYKSLKEATRTNLRRVDLNDRNEIWLGLKDGKALLHNFPMTEVVTGHEVDYEISEAEPLNSHAPSND